MVGPVRVLRPDGPDAVLRGAGPRRAAAPAHRPGHRDLPVRRRDPAPRQPGHAAADPPGRHELDDRGPRHRALRAHAPALRPRRPRCSASSPGRAAAPRRGRAAFVHHAGAHLPVVDDSGLRLRLIVGELCGARSPVARSRAVLRRRRARGRRRCRARRARGARGLRGRGRGRGRGRRLRGRQHAGVPRRASGIALRAGGGARACCCSAASRSTGRATCTGTSSPARSERIEQAKADWQAGRFGKVPGDENEFIPLPE